THVAERYSSAMHGRVSLLDTGYSGIDEENLYCRLDFAEPLSDWTNDDTHLVLTFEPVPADGAGTAGLTYRLEADISSGRLRGWTFFRNGEGEPVDAVDIAVALGEIFECRLPLSLMDTATGTLLGVRFSLWRDRLPLDALPREGF